jgi:hypothetical protein
MSFMSFFKNFLIEIHRKKIRHFDMRIEMLDNQSLISGG